MGNKTLRVSYKGKDFKVFFTIALIYRRSTAGLMGYFCNSFKIHIMKLVRPGIGKFVSFLFLFFSCYSVF